MVAGNTSARVQSASANTVGVPAAPAFRRAIPSLDTVTVVVVPSTPTPVTTAPSGLNRRSTSTSLPGSGAGFRLMMLLGTDIAALHVRPKVSVLVGAVPAASYPCTGTEKSSGSPLPAAIPRL
ncbi:hypothetical protein D3C71_1566710 [compost metagenome]